MNILEEVKNTLSKLILMLRDNNIKSKQIAFNKYIDDLVEANKIAKWETINDILNIETDSKHSLNTFHSFINRARKKRPESKMLDTELIKKSSKDYCSKGHNETNESEPEIPPKLLLACLKSEPLARKAMEYNVKPEIISKWGMTSIFQLTRKLNNHIDHRNNQENI